jgi:hypothetical protein
MDTSIPPIANHLLRVSGFFVLFAEAMLHFCCALPVATGARFMLDTLYTGKRLGVMKYKPKLVGK